MGEGARWVWPWRVQGEGREGWGVLVLAPGGGFHAEALYQWPRLSSQVISVHVSGLRVVSEDCLGSEGRSGLAKLDSLGSRCGVALGNGLRYRAARAWAWTDCGQSTVVRASPHAGK